MRLFPHYKFQECRVIHLDLSVVFFCSALDSLKKIPVDALIVLCYKDNDRQLQPAGKSIIIEHTHVDVWNDASMLQPATKRQDVQWGFCARVLSVIHRRDMITPLPEREAEGGGVQTSFEASWSGTLPQRERIAEGYSDAVTQCTCHH